MSGLRFCFLTTFYPPHNFGGDGIGIQRLARGLARAGHHVTVVHDLDAYRVLARGHTPAGEPEPPGIEVVTLRSRLGIVSPLLTQQFGRPVANGRRIAELLSGFSTDVLANITSRGAVKPAVMTATSTQQAARAAATAPATKA